MYRECPNHHGLGDIDFELEAIVAIAKCANGLVDVLGEFQNRIPRMLPATGDRERATG